MKNKKLILIILFVLLFAVGVGVYFIFSKENKIGSQRCDDGFRFNPALNTCISIEKSSEETAIDFSTIEFKVPDSSSTIRLEETDNGIYSGTYRVNTSGSEGYISLNPTKQFEFSDNLILIPFVVNSGGTGNFSYVALLNKKDNIHISSVFIGDRVEVGTIVQSGELAKINYKNRTESQNYSDLVSVPSQVVVEVKDTDLTQIMRLQNSDYNQIEIKSPVPNSTLSGEFMLKGSMPGTWYFEAISQFKIVDDSYTEIAIGTIQALSEWMTEQRVPFEMKLDSNDFGYNGRATIIIYSENIEGGLEGELKVKKMEIPVIIK